MLVPMEDIIEPTIGDYTVRPILCGPIGSSGDVSNGKPRNVDYLCALLQDDDMSNYGEDT